MTLQARTVAMSLLCFLPFSIKTESPFIFPSSIKLDVPTIKVQPDFSSLGINFGYEIENLFRSGARSFNKAINNDEYRKDIKDGMGGVAKSFGDGVHEFNQEARSNNGLYPELTTTFREFMSTAVNKRNALQFGGTLALSIAVTVTGYYLTRFLWDLLSYKIFNPKPVILLPETNYGRIDRLKRWWKGYKTPEMIFDAAVKERLTETEDKTKHIRSHNKKRKNKYNKMNYDNLLLHGEPGTGKTLFARVLADRCNMDFVATTAASLLQSGVAGVKYVNEIVAMARRSSYGMILFIDEADSLFVDRDTLDPDSDHYKVLSHILALTGDGNSTFMLIAATNHAYVIDSAMGRRFQDRILMPLPSADTRRELINLYIDKLLFNKNTNDKTFIETAHKVLSDAIINSLVEKTEKLSHAEIKDMIHAIHKKAYACEHQLVTPKHVNDAVNQAVEKHDALRGDQREKEKKRKLKYKN